MNFSNLTNDPKIEVTPRFVISNNGNYTYPTYNSCLQFKPSDFLYFKLTLRNSTIQQFIGKAILRVYCYGINGNLTAKLYNCGGYTFATNENYELDSNNEEYIDVASVSECGNGETILSFDITSHIRKLDNGDSIVLGFKIVQLINANGYIEVDVPSNKEVCLVTEPVVSGLNGIYKYDNHQIGDVNLSINLFDGQPVFSSQIVKTLGERLPLEFSLFQYYKKYFDADGISHLRNGVVPNFYYQIDRSNDDYHHLMQPDGTIKVYKQLWDESLEQLELELGVKNIICGASLFYCYSDKTYYFIDDSTNDIMMYLYDKYNNKITYQLEDVGSNPVRYITRIMEVETLQKDKITYTWNGNRLSSVANSEGEVMEFEYVESGYISKVKIPQMNCHVLISETSNSINVVLYNELSNGQNTKIKEFTVYFSNGQITSIYDSILKQYLDLDYYNGRVSKATIFNQTKSEKLYSTEYTYTKEYTQVLDSLGNKVFHYFDSYGRVLTSIDDSGNVSSCSYLDGVTNCMIYETRYVANCGNLLYNSSFDNSINISTNQSCWNVTSNESIVSIVNETPFSNKCLKIEGVSTEKVIVKQTASVKKSGTYKLTGYIKHPNLEMLTSDNLKVIVYGTYSTLNPDNFSLETNTFEKNATLNFANNDWYQFEVNDLEIIEGAAGIKLEVCLEVDRVSTVVYFDNLFLVNSMIKSNYNIIENGNFDFQINNIPLGWTFSNMGVEDKLFSNSGNKFSNMLGNNVFVIAPGNRMADTSSATYALRRMSCTQIVKGYANENLTFNVLAKADITSYVTFKAYIKINFKDGSNERYEMNFVKNCINWQLLSTSIITKGDYSSVEVGIYYDGGVEATIGSIQLYKSNGGIHYKYDKFNNLVEIIDVDGDITKYKYNQNNQVVEVYSTKDNYRKNSYYKDRLSNSKNAYGDLNEYIYDGENHLTKERVLLYNGDISRSVTYDESNRKTFKDEYENSTTCACDSLKRPWIITSPCGQQTIYSYNSKLLLESVQATINSMINKNTLTYDEKGLLGIAEEYSGNKYVTQYDTFGRIVSISCNDNLLETYEYDSLLNGYRKGLLVGKRVASNGGYYEFEYDDNNRLSKVKLNGSVIATYKYYADGSLFEIYDVQNLETIRYKYDEKDRIKQINTNDDSIEYKYNFSCIKSVYNIDGDIRSCEYGHDVKENIYSYITKLALTYNNRVVTDTEYINAAKVIDKSYLQIFDYSLNIRLMKFFEYSSYYSFEADGDKSFIAWVKPSEKGTENSKVNVISFNSEGNTPVAYLRVNEDNTLTFHNSNISIQTGVKMKLDEWNLVGVNFKGTGTNKIIQIILNGTITEQSANDMNFDFKSFTLSNQNNLMASAQYLAKPLTYLVALSSSHVYSEEEVKDIYELGKLALMTNDELHYNAISYYDNNVYDGFDVFTLNNNLISTKGLEPISTVNEYVAKYNNKHYLFANINEYERYVYKAIDGELSSKNTLKYQLPLSTVGSISLLFNFRKSQKDKYVLSFRDDLDEKFGIFIDSNDVVNVVVNGINVTPHGQGQILTSEEWCHFIIRYSSDKIQIYFDTTLIYEISSAINLENTILYLGNSVTSENPINGMMEMFAYSNEYISDERKAQIFSNVLSTFIKDKVDRLGRIKEKQISSGFSQFSIQYTYDKTRVTSQILPNGDTISYTYDVEGRVTSKTIMENGVNKIETYSYDTNGRLVQYECDGITTTYTYNEIGNIVNISSTNSVGKVISNFDYQYKLDVKDALSQIYNNNFKIYVQQISYNDDNLFYPSSMKIKGVSSQLIWEGKRLIQIGANINYTYNHQGIRIKKVTPNETTTFKLEGRNIIRMNKIVGSNDYVLDFIYDSNNQIVGLNTAEGHYFYVKDITGNILGLLDSNGDLVVKYKYDPWGRVTKTIMTSCVASNHNPFLYKGYYYDDETQLFYCNSRYYSPELCRWISPDSIEYLDPSSINGLNLYCYCMNDPVNLYDPSGHAWETVFDIGFAIWSLIDFIKDPTWANAGWLALDVLALAVPFLPGGSKVITKADDIVDAVGFVNKYDEVIVLGQSMGKRVIPYADEIGATFYKGLDNFNDLENSIGTVRASLIGYFDNMGYIAKHTFNGAKFIDKGFDASRTLKGLKGMDLFREVMSRVTIHSEKFLAQLLRKKNVFRFFRHWLF